MSGGELLMRLRYALGVAEGTPMTPAQLVYMASQMRQKAAKWDEWVNAQAAIEAEMPEGWAFEIRCSPGDWDTALYDPDHERVRFDRDDETTAQMMLSAIEHAKKLAEDRKS